VIGFLGLLFLIFYFLLSPFISFVGKISK
jgi:hypothetical protein